MYSDFQILLTMMILLAVSCIAWKKFQIHLVKLQVISVVLLMLLAHCLSYLTSRNCYSQVRWGRFSRKLGYSSFPLVEGKHFWLCCRQPTSATCLSRINRPNLGWLDYSSSSIYNNVSIPVRSRQDPCWAHFELLLFFTYAAFASTSFINLKKPILIKLHKALKSKVTKVKWEQSKVEL